MSPLLNAVLWLIAASSFVTIYSLQRFPLLKAALIIPALVVLFSVGMAAWAIISMDAWDSLILMTIVVQGLVGVVASVATGLLAGGLWLRYQRRP